LPQDKVGLAGVDVMPPMMGGMMPMAAGAAPPASSAPEAAAEEESAPAKEFFDLKLLGFDAASKIKVIKEVRALSGLGLKEVCRYLLLRVVSSCACGGVPIWGRSQMDGVLP
jgi:hypothetical protein